MNREAFQRLSGMRLAEGEALLRHGLSAGAYYLLGLAVECALKACVCKLARRYDFPDCALAALALSANTHDLGALLRLAAIDEDLKEDMARVAGLRESWRTTSDWSVGSRYEADVPTSVTEELHRAVTTANGGVLPWIRSRW